MNVSHTQLVQTGQPLDRFPYGALKCLGGFQIALGLLIIGCGVTDLQLNYFFYTIDFNSYYYRDSYSRTFYNIERTSTMVSAPIWCGAWFFFTGIFGACITRNRQSYKRCLRNSFQTLSILTAVIFAPTLMGIATAASLYRTRYGDSIFLYVFIGAAAGLGFIEFIVAIVSASVCCCCSTIDQRETQVLYIPGSVPGQQYVTVISTVPQPPQQLPPQSQHYMSPTAPMAYQQPGPYVPYQTGGGPSYQNPNYQQPVAGGNWTEEKSKPAEAFVRGENFY